MRTVLVALVALACLAACSAPPQAELASGSLAGGGWSLWTYRTGNEGTCLEIRALGRQTDRLCGLTADNGGVWQPDVPAGEEAFVAGTLGRADATSVRATLGDGTSVSSGAFSAPAISPLRFYVMVLPAGVAPTRIDLLDARGSVVETTPLR